jgi:hypothetical protein
LLEIKPAVRPSGAKVAVLDRFPFTSRWLANGKFGWGGRIRTFTVLINSEVSYRLDHAPAGLRASPAPRDKTHPGRAKRIDFAASGATKGSPKITRANSWTNAVEQKYQGGGTPDTQWNERKTTKTVGLPRLKPLCNPNLHKRSGIASEIQNIRTYPIIQFA